jgi:hypothetical protein
MPTVKNRGSYRAPIPPSGKLVARPTKFGNPFEVGRDGSREAMVRKHREWLAGEGPDVIYDSKGRAYDRRKVLAGLPELRGRDLFCYCAPEPCHGSTLLKLANGRRHALPPQTE